jgi:hypothetical protein
MLENIKKGLNIFIIFIFAVAILYVIVTFIIDLFLPKNVKVVPEINNEDVEIYLKEKQLVTDYTTFFNIENIIKNIIKDLNDGKYKEVYAIFSDNYKKNITEEEYMKKVEKYLNDNFKYEDNVVDYSGYINNKNLKYLYNLETTNFIAIVKSDNKLKETKIGISIIDTQSFVITYLDL